MLGPEFLRVAKQYNNYETGASENVGCQRRVLKGCGLLVALASFLPFHWISGCHEVSNLPYHEHPVYGFITDHGL